MSSHSSHWPLPTPRSATLVIGAVVCAAAACAPEAVDGPRAAPVAPAALFVASPEEAAGLAAAVSDAGGRLLRSVPAGAASLEPLATALGALGGAVERRDGGAVQRAAARVQAALARLDAGDDAAADVAAIGLALDRVSLAVQPTPADAR